MSEANVIIPAFSGAYALQLFLWPATIIAMVLEIAVFRFRERAAGLAATIASVLLANVVSWLVGITAVSVLPSALVPAPYDPDILRGDPMYNLYAVLSFPLACIISSIIEWTVLYPVRRRLRFTRLLGTIVAANVASYAFLGVAVGVGWVLLGFASTRRSQLTSA